MGDITVGSEVVTPTNEIAKVTAVYPQPIKPIYSLSTNSGKSTEACEEHLWKIKYTVPKKKSEYGVFTTKEVLRLMKEGRTVSVPFPEAISFEKEDLPLDPYTLGFLIGDGCFRGQGSISFTTLDEEVVEYIRDGVKNLNLRIAQQPSTITYYIRMTERFHQTNEKGQYIVENDAVRLIKELGLEHHTSYDKFVPEQYKRGTIEDRLAIVQGLMDSDGCVDETGKSIEFSTSSEQLALDMQEIIWSLGGKAKIVSRIPTYTHKGEKKQGALNYRVYIKMRDDSLIFRLPRKKERCQPVRDLWDKIENLEYVREDYSQCISVDHPEHLYITDDYIVTHNTWVGISKFVRFIDEPEYIGYIIRKTASSLRTGAFETAKKIFKAACPDVKINQNEMSFRFPSGCRIYMKGLDGQQGIDFFQGQEISGVLIDEATHLNAEEVSWILTRLRTNSNAKPTAWMSCNPDNSSWLLDWVEWYLHPKKTYVTEGDVTFDIGGRPDQDKNEMLRWFLVINGLYVWDTDRDRLIETYKDSIEDGQYPMSFRFIGATYKDNPMIDRKYVSDLLNKSRIEKERLVFGSWHAKPEGSGFWSNEWCKKLKTFPHDDDPDDEIVKRVRCWDLAYTEPHEGNMDPDYTVGVLMAQTKKGYYIVEHVVRAQLKVGRLYRYIADIALKDCDMYGVIPQILPEDPASGKATFAFAREYLMSSGVPAVTKVSGSNQRNKVERFKNFAAASENQAVYIMEADWNDVYFTELEAFDGTRNVRHDDHFLTNYG